MEGKKEERREKGEGGMKDSVLAEKRLVTSV